MSRSEFYQRIQLVALMVMLVDLVHQVLPILVAMFFRWVLHQ